MESGKPEDHRSFLPRKLLILSCVSTFLVLAGSPSAFAGNTSSQYTTSANATASGGAISASASDESWSPPAGSPWARAAGSDPRPGKPNPNQPYGCSYYVGGPQAQETMGTGGATPGVWVFPFCSGPGVIDPMPPIWVTNAQQQAAPANPAVLIQQALSKLPLAAPTIEMAPPANQDQLVNVSTWLWIEPAAWQQLSATANAGPVTTTATAAPAEVVWQMGDGQSVTCIGPGTPYNPSDPNATTDCSYTWTQSSAGQPDGVYQVTATIYYRATWTATGAPGGGNLGLVAGPAAHEDVAVAQSEAINNSPGS
jgi:hypothetical protein